MSENEAGTTIERRDPEETFGLLGDETRVEILRAFGSDADDTMTFSELRDQVGMRDSGQFNYHLKKLTGTFLRKTDEGYSLTLAGHSVVGAMLSGTYTATAEMDPIDMADSTCLECGAPLRVEYEDEAIHIICTECGETHGNFSVPPSTLEQFDRAELPKAFDRWIRSQFAQVVSGFCPNCSGRLSPSIDRMEDEDVYVARYDCTHCGEEIWSSVPASLLFRPEVIAFAYEHGLDPLETPFWELEWLQKGNTKVVSSDPLQLRVRISMGGELLDMTLDEDLAVIGAVRQ